MRHAGMTDRVPVVALSIAIGAASLFFITKRKKKVEGTHTDDDDMEDISKQGFTMKKVPKNLDMIVIGSGMGGMVLSAMMAKAGKKVLVLEQHDVAGGNTHTFEEHGYEFDTGVHYIGGMVGDKRSSLRFLIDYITDNGIEWERMDDIYDVAITHNGSKREEFSIRSGFKEQKNDLINRFPEESEAIETYFNMIKAAPMSINFLFMMKVLPPFFSNIFERFARSRLQLFHQTALEGLSSLTTNKELIGVLTYFWGDYGEPPARASLAMNLLLAFHFGSGAFYPVGGPAVIAKKVVRVIEKAGGKVLVRAPVSSILINENGRAYGVQVKRNRIRAPIVVSTVGAPKTFQELVSERHHSRIQRHLDGLNDPNVAPAISMASLFVGIKGDAEELKLPKRNLWIFPSWDHDKNCEKFREDASSPLPAVFMSFSSVKDPTYKDRHPGRQVALVICPSYYETFEKYNDLRVKNRGEEYNRLKKDLTERLLDSLTKEFPQLEGKIDYIDLGTPVTCDYYLGNHRGAIYGLGHTPARFKCDWLRPTTPIQNLYMAGQDVLLNGIAGAAFGGVLCAMSISKSVLLQKDIIFNVMKVLKFELFPPKEFQVN